MDDKSASAVHSSATKPSVTTASAKPATGPRKRRLAYGIAVLTVLASLGVAATALVSFEKEAPPATATVVQGDVESTVTSLGKIKPKDYVDVGTQVSGQLRKVHVDIGDRVKEGQLIAEVDSAVYQTRVRTGRANLDNLRAQLVQLQAELKLARQQAEREQDLLRENATSQDSVEQSQSALNVAAARVAATQAQIVASQATLDGDIANLGYTRIHAPMSGVVVSQTSLEGQTVNASQSAPVIVRVANMDTMTVWAQVAEADVLRIKPDMPAYFSTLGAPDKRWRGTVRQVLPTPETVNDVVLYNVLVDVDNRDQVLMSDMTVQVFFVLAEARGAPVVPLGALRRSPQGGYQAQVLGAQGVVTRKVEVGVTSRSTAQVLSGLSVGDKVVVPEALADERTGGADKGRSDGASRRAQRLGGGPRL